MSIIGIVLVLVVIGVLLALLHRVVTMDARIRWLIDAIVIIAAVVWALEQLGVIDASDLSLRSCHGRAR